VRVLTDPVFGDRIGPASFIGPKRFHARPVEIAELPKLDAILVSHDHFDHLCKASVIELAKLRVPFVTSLGVGAYLEAYGAEQVIELDWWESTTVGGVRFTATPAQHFSGRVGGRNATLWSSWVIETERRRLFFSGDTGLTPEFADVRARFGKIDVAMLEVGAWHPSWGTIHLGPANAVAAFDMLGADALMPIHWATFDLGLHAWAAPGEELLQVVGDRRLLTPRLGVPFEPDHVEHATPWWREVQRYVADNSSAGDAIRISSATS
jgi:L-ascorbate metabolism protein UlaG (beta-lactamase superfamily)